MYIKRTVAFGVILAVLAVSMPGCGAKSETVDNGTSMNRYYDGLYDGAEQSITAASEAKTNSDSSGVAAQKLIRTMDIDAETDDLDGFLREMESKLEALGGYIESQSLRNGGDSAAHRYRYGNMTVRIPTARMGEFVEHVSGASNVVSYHENAEDITLRYVATQSRVTALETEQQRLLELLAKAESMSDLLQIEERLTSVRTELEQETSQKRLYDNMVDFGTVQLTVTQVQAYTVVEDQTVWKKIGSGLTENWKVICAAAEWLFVFVVTSFPYLLPAGGIVAIAAAKRSKKHRKKEKASIDEKEA